MDAYWLFAGVWLLAAAAPGADTALLVSTTIASGWRSALAASLGITMAKILLLIVAFFGLDAILTSAPQTFIALKVFGVLFLLWKAFQFWHTDQTFSGGDTKSSRQNFAVAFVTAISNPQAMLFYVAIVPQIAASTNLVVLASIIAVGFPIISVFYMVLASPIRLWANRSNNQIILNRALAVAFALIALVVAIR